MAITGLKGYLQQPADETEHTLREHCYEVIGHCAQNMNYPQFYYALHGEPSPVRALENQFTDIRSQLQPTDKIYPLWIDAQAPKGETDTSAIAQEVLTGSTTLGRTGKREILCAELFL